MRSDVLPFVLLYLLCRDKGRCDSRFCCNSCCDFPFDRDFCGCKGFWGCGCDCCCDNVCHPCGSKRCRHIYRLGSWF